MESLLQTLLDFIKIKCQNQQHSVKLLCTLTKTLYTGESIRQIVLKVFRSMNPFGESPQLTRFSCIMATCPPFHCGKYCSPASFAMATWAHVLMHVPGYPMVMAGIHSHTHAVRFMAHMGHCD